MPLLSAKEENLPKEYLLRAAIVITAFSHAYFYFEKYTDGDQLPDSVLKPLEEISERLNDGIVGRTFLEDFIANWDFR
jgi:hypothetical protein